ncbi:MAG: hypothetical protein KJO44_02420, partial [Gemmatimonadetes bacterium]|nr:hypothetical protein [Gemmatimonadota bacterium]
MADPLHSVRGNDRWVVHIARGVALGLHGQILTALGSIHPEEHEWAVVRRGFEDSWEAPEGAPFRMWVSRKAATLHAVPESSIDAPLSALHYQLGPSAEDEAFAPHYAPIKPIPRQIARFRGPLGQQVALSAPFEDASRSTPIELVVSSSPGEPDLTLTALPEAERATFLADVPRDTLLVSLETRGPAGARRSRGGLAPLPESRFGVSDILLVQPGPDGVPEDRGAAVARMLPARALQAESTMGLYVELYSEPETMVTFRLFLRRMDGGILSGLLRRLGRGGATEGAEIVWTETTIGSSHPVG